MGTATLTVDHDAGVIRGAALMEIGHGPITHDLAEAYLKATNGKPVGSHADRHPPAQSRADRLNALERTALDAPSDRVDMFLRLFFDGGPRDHLEGIDPPLVRLGHPTGGQMLRVDLRNEGAVVGHVREGWLDGTQLRGDVHLMEAAPVDDWRQRRAALLAIADRDPTAFGVSAAHLLGLPMALDLVQDPGGNVRGLVGGTDVVKKIVGRRPDTDDVARHEDWLLSAMTSPGSFWACRGPGRGSWQVDDTLDDETINLSCPDCGETIPIERDQITRRGDVRRWISCCTPRCGFTKAVSLLDWPGDEGQAVATGAPTGASAVTGDGA